MVVVALAEKDAIGPQADMDKASILDQDVLEADDFIEGKFVFPGLQYSLAPTFQPVAWRPFPFDFKTRAAIGQQQEARGARHDMSACPAESFSRLLGHPALRKSVELFGATY